MLRGYLQYALLIFPTRQAESAFEICGEAFPRL